MRQGMSRGSCLTLRDIVKNCSECCPSCHFDDEYEYSTLREIDLPNGDYVLVCCAVKEDVMDRYTAEEILERLNREEQEQIA